MKQVVEEAKGAVAVIIPARNEELSIGPVVAGVKRLHEGFEVVAVSYTHLTLPTN